MTNIDLFLKVQNDAVLTRIEALTTKSANVKLNIQPTGLKSFRTTIRDYLQAHPVQVAVKIDQKSLNSLGKTIGTIPINLSIANSPQILAQIQALVASAGGGVINPAAARTRAGRNPVKSSALLREQARFIRAGEATPEDLGQIPQGTIGRSIGGAQSLSTGRGIKNIKARGDLLALRQAEEAAAKRAAKLASTQELFERDFRFQRLFFGKDKAARDLEVKKGLPAGSINTGFKDKALDFNRLKNPEAFNELAFAGLFGGTTGLVGGAVGGAALGRPGVFLGSAAAQVVVNSIQETFGKIVGILGEVASAGLELQKSLLGLSTAFLTTGKFVDAQGKDLPIGENISAANARARNLLQSTAPALSNIGIPLGTTALALRRTQTALGERGIGLDDKQLSKINQVVLARVAAFDPELLQQPQKLGTGLENIFGAASNAKTGELAQVLGVQNVEKITQAVKTGNIDQLIQTIESLGGALEFLSKNTETAVTPINRLNTVFTQMQQTVGDKFLQSITPALNEFVNVLAKQDVAASFESIARALGEVTGGVIKFAATILDAFSTDKIVEAGRNIDRAIQSILAPITSIGPTIAKAAINSIAAAVKLIPGVPKEAVDKIAGGANKALDAFVPTVPIFESIGKGVESSAKAAELKKFYDSVVAGAGTGATFVPNQRPVTLLPGADVDSETFAGRIEAKRIEQQEQITAGKITPRVAALQLERLKVNTAFEEKGESLRVEETLRKLPDVLEVNRLKFDELNSALTSTTDSLRALDNQTQINRLEGEDKAIALIGQQAASGGVLSREQADLLNERFGPKAGLILNEGILGGGLNTEDRKKQLASLQLTTFLQGFNPENQAKAERSRLLQQQVTTGGSIRDLDLEREQAILNAQSLQAQLQQKQGGVGTAPSPFSKAGSPITTNIPTLPAGAAASTASNDVFQNMVSVLNTIAVNTAQIANSTRSLDSKWDFTSN